MPEIITKYPEVLKKELKDIGAKCGEGLKPQILTTCPKENFCVLPTGEICIYSIDTIAQMTQLSTSELSDVLGPIPTIYSDINIVLLCVACLFGLLMGVLVSKRTKK